LSQWDLGFDLEIDGLIAQVTQACKGCPSQEINFGFFTFQFCLEETLVFHGDNKCKSLTQLGKEGVLVRAGALPVCVAALARACLVAREVVGEVDGDFVDDGAGDALDDALDDACNDACDDALKHKGGKWKQSSEQSSSQLLGAQRTLCSATLSCCLNTFILFQAIISSNRNAANACVCASFHF
jgi:hypothetical protein